MSSSPPVWGAWIEIKKHKTLIDQMLKSPPVWGAWIEIIKAARERKQDTVAPRMGGVD